jgi:hypothetical protein
MTLQFVIGDPVTHVIDPQDMEQDISFSEKSELCEELSDVVFSVGPEDETAVLIPAHSFILKSAGTVFESMFSGKWKEQDVIRVKDYDVTTVYSLLRWIYAQELVFEEGKLYDLLRIADMFLMDSLFEAVTKACTAVEMEVTCKFTWTVLSFAIEFKKKDLIETCLKAIRWTCAEYLKLPDSLTASEAAVHMVVSQDDLNVDEIDLIKWAFKWAEEECKRRELDPGTSKRQVMDSFIHQLSFSGIRKEEFASIYRETGILTDEEIIDVINNQKRAVVNSVFRKCARKSDIILRPYAVIKTAAGLMYKVPLAALQRKEVGQQITFGTGAPGVLRPMTTATIMSKHLIPPVTSTPVTG